MFGFLAKVYFISHHIKYLIYVLNIDLVKINRFVFFLVFIFVINFIFRSYLIHIIIIQILDVIETKL